MSILKKTELKEQKTYILTLTSGKQVTLDPTITANFPKEEQLKGLNLLPVIRDTYNAINSEDRAVLVELKDPSKESALDKIEAKKKQIQKLLAECEQIAEESTVSFVYRGPDYTGYTYIPKPTWVTSTDVCDQNLSFGWRSSSDNC